MFDLTDEREEKKRHEWYSPIGEYVLLFSNLEFELSNWIHLLSNSRALRNISSTVRFSKRLEVLLDLIEEYEILPETKEKWKCEWQTTRVMAKTRNLICHNSPIDNFSLFMNEAGEMSLSLRAVEVQILKKPIGEPGSGLSLTELQKNIERLRQLLIRLDSMHTEEIVRCS